ncbi:MAG: transposase [Hyphomicrobiaceae bacterium]
MGWCIKAWAGDRWVPEATGAYDRTLRAALAAACIRALRVNPGRARDFARAAGYLAKTDAVDARMLAAMGRAIAMRPAEPVDPRREELNALARQRDWLVRMDARLAGMTNGEQVRPSSATLSSRASAGQGNTEPRDFNSRVRPGTQSLVRSTHPLKRMARQCRFNASPKRFSVHR